MSSLDSIPIIDVSPLILRQSGGRERVAAEIGRACRDIGFFYLRNHGIDQALIDAVYAAAQQFFALPEGEKQALSIARLQNNRGYAALGSESLDPTKKGDAKEAFNVGREPEPGETATANAPSQGENQWPTLPGFRDTLMAYYAAVRALSETLHEAFATDLGLPVDYFLPFVDRPLATLRLLRYPPHPEAFDGSRYGAGAHTDYGNITILSQDSVGGLEVQTRAGEWINAPPIEGTFIVNIGDCLMRWSNDIYVSNPHRVTNLARRVRYSVAFFFDPNPDAVLSCLPSCCSADRPARYPPITYAQHLREKLDATYAHRQSPA